MYKDDLIAIYEERLHLADREALEIVMATAAAIYLEGDPLWLLVVGPSGGGKTEMLSMFVDHEDTLMASSITKNTLMSGFAAIKEGEDLIYQLNDKLFIIKDLAPLLEKESSEQTAIMSDLRDAYDGRMVKHWGSGAGDDGTKSWQGKFGLVAAATPAIDGKMIIHAQMGERYLRINLKTDDLQQTLKAILTLGNESGIRSTLNEAGHNFMNTCRDLALSPIFLSAEFMTFVGHIGHAVARLRTTVRLDKDDELRFTPVPEVASRLSKQLIMLGKASALINQNEAPSHRELKLIMRVAKDCIPAERVSVLRCLLMGLSKTVDIDNELSGSSYKTTERELKKLQFLGVVKRYDKDWTITEEWSERLRDTGFGQYFVDNTPPIMEATYDS
jgi:hypothetical protein